MPKSILKRYVSETENIKEVIYKIKTKISYLTHDKKFHNEKEYIKFCTIIFIFYGVYLVIGTIKWNSFCIMYFIRLLITLIIYKNLN